MSARFSENTESGSNISSVEPVIEAGVNRSGKVRLIPLDSGSEAPPAASSTSNLLGNQAVGTSPTPESYLPQLACLLAVREQEVR